MRSRPRAPGTWSSRCCRWLTRRAVSGYVRYVRLYTWLALAASTLAGTLSAVAPASAALPAPPASASAAARVAAAVAPVRHVTPLLGPTFEGGLFGVAALSPTYAWAVGDDGNNTLIVHWNGKKWQKVAAPNPSPGSDDLNAVAALTAKYAWAVGVLGGDGLVMHWNGTAWKTVPTPKLKGGALLAGVTVTSTSNAWIAGGTGEPAHALIEHWNGKAWRTVPTSYTGSSILWAVSASSATNVWAVGSHPIGSNGTGTLILHWNGKSWRRVPAPSPVDSELIGVTTTSATNAWAVGDYSNGTLVNHTLVEHWNGRSWSRVSGPSPRQGAVLFNVSAKTASLAFAVGTTTPLTLPPANPVGQTFLERWDGHTWREVTKPAPIDGQFSAVAFGSRNTAWAVGSNASLGFNPNGWTLIEHWNGTAWG